QFHASDQRERLVQFRAASRIGSRAVAVAAISAERSQRKATNGSGSYQFRAGARTGSRASRPAVPVNKNMK
ncbi:MAG: hypothetical protein II807_02130, partial [Thermoguttaceae bacterium]|nr:hypothetical protein [Thermoguttaceae bacterium]